MKTYVHLALMVMLVLSLLFSCQSYSPQYHWGNFENAIDGHYSEGYTPEKELSLLLDDVKASQIYHVPLPPGFRVHLAYLYRQLGQMDLAETELKNEEKLFPESAKFNRRMRGSF